MANTVGKFGLLLLGVCLLSVAPVFADSTTTFTLTNTLGNIGTSDTFTDGGLSFVATGYSAQGTTADMWAKSEGPIETGIGLASEIDHEISGTKFIQLNLMQILAANPTSIMLTIGSIQAGEAYNVWGSNTAGTPGTLLASNQTSNKFTLPDLGTFNYISISGALDTSVFSNVLISALDVTTNVTTDVTTPEPSSAGLLFWGLVALISVGTLGKKLIS